MTQRALFWALFLASRLAFAQWPPFQISEISFRGLYHVDAATVRRHLPLEEGEVLTPRRAKEIIEALYRSGLFRDIRLLREDGRLIIEVEERPLIREIVISGNRDVKTEDLRKALEQAGIAEGRLLKQGLLEKVERALRDQYYAHGKYGVEISTGVEELAPRQVQVVIQIAEGEVARIKAIEIIGNRAFSDEELLERFELRPTGWFSFYTKSDRYAKEKLAADLERLRSFYMDRGYLKFQIRSAQVTLSPDRREVYITIHVDEGDVFKVERVRLAGKMAVPTIELVPLVKIGPGEIFSRRKITKTIEALGDKLSEAGFLFANITPVPEIDEEKKTVRLTFQIDPGRRVYVRRIVIEGNRRTQDEVIRREIRQMEASLASGKKIKLSKTRLDRLGFFQSVNIETEPVPGVDDLVDLKFTVEERPSGNLMAGVGYSQTQGFLFNASITQENFLGTGKRLTFRFDNSRFSRIYRLGYFNPYLTLEGLSFGIDTSYRTLNARQANISNYTTDVLSGSLTFGMPLSEEERISLSLDAQHTKLSLGNRTANEIIAFVNQHGRQYVTLSVSGGFVHNGLDRRVFPRRGTHHNLSALIAAPLGELSFYKVSYRGQFYTTLLQDLTFALKTEAAYGDGYGSTKELPFFENFFAGGPQSLRGFRANTLGPRDSRNNPFGGSVKLVGSAELFFPLPFLEKKFREAFRIGAFLDAGNVFARVGDVRLNEIRYSIGVSAQWLSPFGPISVSIAQPLNAKKGDDQERFQFSFGAGLF